MRDAGDNGAVCAADDAELVVICAQMIGNQHARDEIAEADESAPDDGPLHAQYEQLHAEWCALAERLTRAPAPATNGGVRAISRLALSLLPRDADGRLAAPSHVIPWLRNQAIVWAAGESDRLPPPDTLPADWRQTETEAVA